MPPLAKGAIARAGQGAARRQVPIEQMALLASVRRAPAPPQLQAKRGVADCAGDIEAVAGPNAGARGMRPNATEPSAVIESVNGPGVLTVSPPISGQA